MENKKSNENILAVCYEQIQDQYYYGLFGDFKLIIDTENGYFNATKLCKVSGKRLKNWLQNKDSKELLKYLYETNEDSKFNHSPFKVVTGRFDNGEYNEIIAGTYLPKQLILSLATWISRDFYFKVYNIVEHYFIREFTEKYKNDKERLNERLNEIERKYNEFQSKTVEIENEKSIITQERDELESLVRRFRAQNEQFEDDVTPKTEADGLLNTLVIVRKNVVDDEYPYYVVRCQRRTQNAAMRNLKERYPRSEIAYEIQYNPNTINLYNRIKEKLKYVTFYTNHMNVLNFEKFIRDIEEMIPKLS